MILCCYIDVSSPPIPPHTPTHTHTFITLFHSTYTDALPNQLYDLISTHSATLMEADHTSSAVLNPIAKFL